MPLFGILHISLDGFQPPSQEITPKGWEFLKNPLFGERKCSWAPSPNPAPPITQPSSDFPPRGYHWSTLFKPEKITGQLSSEATTPNRTNHNNKVPPGNCWKGLSFSSNERVFLPYSHSLFPSAHEETTLAPSSGSQILELRQQISASKSPPSIWCSSV